MADAETAKLVGEHWESLSLVEKESYGIQADKMNVAFAGKDVDSGKINGDLGAE